MASPWCIPPWRTFPNDYPCPLIGCRSPGRRFRSAGRCPGGHLARDGIINQADLLEASRASDELHDEHSAHDEPADDKYDDGFAHDHHGGADHHDGCPDDHHGGADHDHGRPHDHLGGADHDHGSPHDHDDGTELYAGLDVVQRLRLMEHG